MTAILVCGEGPHDIGTNEWSATAQQHIQTEGWIQPILRKIIGNDVEIKTKKLREIALVGGPKVLGLSGHGRRAAMAKFLAKIEGCDRIVFVTDADTNDATARESNFQTILDGFSAINNGVGGTGCVPQSTSESWLLADSKAWQTVAPNSVQALPTKSPESLWGNVDDPNGNHPKHVFKRVCEAGHCSPTRHMRVLIAEATDINELSKRCPDSVRPFLHSCSNPI